MEESIRISGGTNGGGRLSVASWNLPLNVPAIPKKTCSSFCRGGESFHSLKRNFFSSARQEESRVDQPRIKVAIDNARLPRLKHELQELWPFCCKQKAISEERFIDLSRASFHFLSPSPKCGPWTVRTP